MKEKNVNNKIFKKRHRGIKEIFIGFLMGRLGFHEVDENGFEVDEFGNPINN